MKKTTIILVAALAIAQISMANPTRIANFRSKVQVFTVNQNLDAYNGVWVEKTYVEELRKTRSAIKASEKIDGVLAMYIDAEKSMKTTNVLVNFYNHEGFEFELQDVKGMASNSIKTDLASYLSEEDGEQYEITLETEGNQKVLKLLRYNKSKKLIGTTTYVRVANTRVDYDGQAGVQSIANELVIAGKYTWRVANRSYEVEFTIDGTIKNHPNYKKFFLATDYMEYNIGYDEMVLIDKSGEEIAVALVVSGSVIRVHPLNEPNEDGEYTFGKQIFTLTRK